jgi:hemerythrin
MSGILIEWKDFYSVGCPELDAQHQIIIEVINDLCMGMQIGAPEEAKKHLIDRLVRYTHAHFQREEQVMQYFGYPDTAEHQGLHNQMTHCTLELRSRYQEVSFSELLQFLKEWWTEHICGEDKRYSPYVKRGLAKPPGRESGTESPFLLVGKKR